MTTLTVYFCGTGSNKFDDTHVNYWNGELISTLAANNKGKEFKYEIDTNRPNK